ncbi:MAG: hypothetical protein AAF335_04035, partial [Bacteroidota bacterium]
MCKIIYKNKCIFGLMISTQLRYLAFTLLMIGTNAGMWGQNVLAAQEKTEETEKEEIVSASTVLRGYFSDFGFDINNVSGYIKKKEAICNDFLIHLFDEKNNTYDLEANVKMSAHDERVTTVGEILKKEFYPITSAETDRIQKIANKDTLSYKENKVWQESLQNVINIILKIQEGWYKFLENTFTKTLEQKLKNEIALLDEKDVQYVPSIDQTKIVTKAKKDNAEQRKLLVVENFEFLFKSFSKS